MEIDLLFSGIAISDLATSVAWYASLFGRPPDVVVADDEVMWNVSAAGWVYIVVDPLRSGQSLVTVSVTDLDRAVSELGQRGLVPVSIDDVPGAGARKATLRDPDHNVVAIIDVTEASNGA